jgi:hypothetical protein
MNQQRVALVVGVALCVTVILVTVCCTAVSKSRKHQSYILPVPLTSPLDLQLEPERDMVLCRIDEAKFMEEFLRFIVQKTSPPLKLVLYTKSGDGFPEIDAHSGRFICVRRVPDRLLHDPTASIVFINTEQLTAPHNIKEFRVYTRRPDVAVFDYCKANMRLSGLTRHGHFPLEENAEETKELKAILHAVGGARCTHDAAVVGSPTGRRLTMVKALISAGLDVVFIKGFGVERDERIAACRVLLNLHAYSNFTLYEALRCDRWLYAGMPIVTEPCLDATAIPPGVVVVNGGRTGDVVDAVRQAIATIAPVPVSASMLS